MFWPLPGRDVSASPGMIRVKFIESTVSSTDVINMSVTCLLHITYDFSYLSDMASLVLEIKSRHIKKIKQYNKAHEQHLML